MKKILRKLINKTGNCVYFLFKYIKLIVLLKSKEIRILLPLYAHQAQPDYQRVIAFDSILTLYFFNIIAID